MTYGGTPVQVRGELTWSPPPPAWVVWPLYAALAPVAAVLLGRGPRPLGLLLVQGLPDVDVLWTANALAGGPVLLIRAAVAVLVTLGAGCVVGGLLATHRFRERRRPAGEPLLGQ